MSLHKATHVIYNEIVGFENYITVRISIEEAIQRQRLACVQRKGYDIYESDERALDDFMVIHWAWKEVV